MLNTSGKQHALLMDWDRGKALGKLYNIEDLSKINFWYYSNDTKRNRWLMLCSHWPINFSCDLLPFTLQLCYKPLAILQRVTKSQNVHISSHDGLENFITSALFDTGHRVSQRGSRVAGIFPFSSQILWGQYIYCSSYSGSTIHWLPSIHHINFCWEP